jgi:predicted nucleic acid-binding protein
VCRSWRAALEERSLWLRLDLSASGVSPKRAVTDALLHAAAARAGGELLTLDISGCSASLSTRCWLP